MCAALEQRQHDRARGTTPLDNLQVFLEGDELLESCFQLGAGDLRPVSQDQHARFRRSPQQPLLHLALVADEELAAAALRPEQRRLRDVDVAGVDQRAHLTVEERQQQRTDVRSVDVGVGHDDDAVVAQLGEVEILAADAASERRDHGLDLVAAEHLVEPGLLDVENLSLDRKDRLEPPIAALLRRSACRLTFDDVELALRRDRAPGSRRACREASCCRARPCGGPDRGPCAPLHAPAPHPPPWR